MKQKLPYIVMFIVFAGIVISFVLLKKENIVLGQKNTELKKEVARLNIDSSIIQNERWLSFLSIKENGKEIDKSIVLESENNLMVSSYVSAINEPKFIVRFSYLGCNVCMDSALAIIKKYESVFKEKNMVLMATYDNKNNLELFKNVNRIKYPTFFVQPESRIIEADKYSIPYMFVLLPKQSAIRDLFFPMKEDMGRTDEYLKIISNKYFKNDIQ